MTCSQRNFGVVTSVDMSKSADFLSGTGRLSGAFVIGGDVIFYFLLHSFFYNNAFGTAVKFEDLMALKKELIVRRKFSDLN